MGVQTPGGQRNTNSNAGAGAGLVKPKVGLDTPVKSIVAGANITINENADDIEIVATGGGGGAVDSVFTRTGAVVAVAGDYDADQIDNTPAGSIVATNVQGALNGLDTTKAPLAGATITTASVNGVTLENGGAATDFLNKAGGYTVPTDADAIHDNVAGEINAIASKATPVGADILLIEDSADSFNKKKIAITDLPGGGGAVDSVFTRTGAVVAVAGDYTASEVTNVPAGSIIATDAQAAITELDTEKAPNSGATMTTASVNGVTLTAAGAATNFLTEAGTYLVPAGSGDGHVIEDNGTPVTQRASLNFTNFTVVDNSGDDATEITIPALAITTGTEYNTGKTIGGDIVYGKIIDLGAGASTGTAASPNTAPTAHGITGIKRWWKAELMCHSTGSDTGFEVTQVKVEESTSTHTLSEENFFTDATNVSWVTVNDRSAFNGQALMEYTKD